MVAPNEKEQQQLNPLMTGPFTVSEVCFQWPLEGHTLTVYDHWTVSPHAGL